MPLPRHNATLSSRSAPAMKAVLVTPSPADAMVAKLCVCVCVCVTCPVSTKLAMTRGGVMACHQIDAGGHANVAHNSTHELQLGPHHAVLIKKVPIPGPTWKPHFLQCRAAH
jgi:hypothetical protein